MVSKDYNKNIAILDILEQDRRRIAREIHDTSLQNLTHLIHQINLAGMMIDKDPVKAKLELAVINKELHNDINEIRNIVFDLHPIDIEDLGLKASCEELIDGFNENNKYNMDVEIEDISCKNNIVLVNIYRIVKECFTNITKHSGADKVIFKCYSDDNFCFILIEDNGKGFDFSTIGSIKERHFGITLLKERVNLLNGNIEIKSEPDKGVNIHVKIPLKNM